MLDLLGTLSDRRTADVDRLQTWRDVESWVQGAGVRVDDLDGEDADVPRVQALREALYRLLTGGLPVRCRRRTTARSSTAPRRAAVTPHLTGAGEVRWTGGLEGVLGAVARDGLDLLASPDLHMLRECADPHCTRLFVDRSRGGRRRWCGMKGCGDRAKAAPTGGVTGPPDFDLRSPPPRARLAGMSKPPVPPDRSDGPVPGEHDDGRRGGDAGLFGPDSVTWRVHAEPLMGVAGLRALLLQALHPVALAAFSEHSTYRQDWWGRLSRTAEYIAVTTFGSTTDAMFAASRVRAIHARVHGTLPDGSATTRKTPSSSGGCTAAWSPRSSRSSPGAGLALSGAEQDAYVAEQVRAAMLVGLEPDEVPHDRAALLDYFRVIRPALECTPVARRAARDLVVPPMPARIALATPARPAWAGIAGLAFAALPPWGRRLYALPELPGAAGLTDAATTVGLRTLRTALRGARAVVPPLQENAHLHAARERLRIVPDPPPDAPWRPPAGP